MTHQIWQPETRASDAQAWFTLRIYLVKFAASIAHQNAVAVETLEFNVSVTEAKLLTEI